MSGSTSAPIPTIHSTSGSTSEPSKVRPARKVLLESPDLPVLRERPGNLALRVPPALGNQGRRDHPGFPVLPVLSGLRAPLASREHKVR